MHPAVVERMRKSWEGTASHWASWGRLDVLELDTDTNNPLERFFGVCKYDLLDGKTQRTIQELIDALLCTATVYYMQLRALQLAGRGSSDQWRRAQRTKEWVEKQASSGAVAAAAGDGCAPGLATVTTDEGEGNMTKVCLGDLSCSCKGNGEQGTQGGRCFAETG